MKKEFIKLLGLFMVVAISCVLFLAMPILGQDLLCAPENESISLSQGDPQAISNEESSLNTERTEASIEEEENIASATDTQLAQENPESSQSSPLSEETNLPLEGLIVIIDSGHGGKDPGAESLGSSPKLCESSINWDITIRLYEKVKSLGGMPFLTVQNSETGAVDNGFPPCDAYKSMTFADQKGGSVYNHGAGLFRRLKFSNDALSYFSDKDYRVIFVSIHVDSMQSKRGRRAEGAHVMYSRSQSSNELADALAESFSESPDLRRTLDGKLFEPLHKTARDIVILRGITEGKKNNHGQDINKIKNRVVVETGNLANAHDCKRLTDPLYREELALRILKGISIFYTK